MLFDCYYGAYDSCEWYWNGFLVQITSCKKLILMIHRTSTHNKEFNFKPSGVFVILCEKLEHQVDLSVDLSVIQRDSATPRSANFDIQPEIC